MTRILPWLGLLPLLLATLLPPAPAAAQVTLNRLIIVAADGSSGQNCNRLLDLLEDITDASKSNRYLIRLQPGSYFCNSRVFVPPFVTLEGAGTEASWILGDLPNDSLGLVNLSSDSELRHVFVQNRWGSANPVPDNAAIIAVSAFGFSFGSGTPVERARLVDVVAQGLSVQANPTFGVKATNAHLEVLRSILRSESSGSVAATTATGSVSIAYSRLILGGVSGNVSCRYSYQFPLTPINENCL